MADHEHDHSHGTLKFLKTDVDDATVASLRVFHPALADNLLYARRFAELGDEDKRLLLETQRAVEMHTEWTPGYHAAGDMCAGCRTPTTALFADVFENGAIEYAGFVDDVPVHARQECLDALVAKLPRRSPQVMDKLRRESVRDRDRPPARMTQFFRHDVLAHPPFALEDWANSVAEANQGKLERSTMRDMERLLQYVHKRLYH